MADNVLDFTNTGTDTGRSPAVQKSLDASQRAKKRLEKATQGTLGALQDYSEKAELQDKHNIAGVGGDVTRAIAGQGLKTLGNVLEFGSDKLGNPYTEKWGAGLGDYADSILDSRSVSSHAAGVGSQFDHEASILDPSTWSAPDDLSLQGLFHNLGPAAFEVAGIAALGALTGGAGVVGGIGISGASAGNEHAKAQYDVVMGLDSRNLRKLAGFHQLREQYPNMTERDIQRNLAEKAKTVGGNVGAGLGALTGLGFGALGKAAFGAKTTAELAEQAAKAAAQTNLQATGAVVRNTLVGGVSEGTQEALEGIGVKAAVNAAVGTNQDVDAGSFGDFLSGAAIGGPIAGGVELASNEKARAAIVGASKKVADPVAAASKKTAAGVAKGASLAGQGVSNAASQARKAAPSVSGLVEKVTNTSSVQTPTNQEARKKQDRIAADALLSDDLPSITESGSIAVTPADSVVSVLSEAAFNETDYTLEQNTKAREALSTYQTNLEEYVEHIDPAKQGLEDALDNKIHFIGLAIQAQNKKHGNAPAADAKRTLGQNLQIANTQLAQEQLLKLEELDINNEKDAAKALKILTNEVNNLTPVLADLNTKLEASIQQEKTAAGQDTESLIKVVSNPKSSDAEIAKAVDAIAENKPTIDQTKRLLSLGVANSTITPEVEKLISGAVEITEGLNNPKSAGIVKKEEVEFAKEIQKRIKRVNSLLKSGKSKEARQLIDNVDKVVKSYITRADTSINAVKFLPLAVRLMNYAHASFEKMGNASKNTDQLAEYNKLFSSIIEPENDTERAASIADLEEPAKKAKAKKETVEEKPVETKPAEIEIETETETVKTKHELNVAGRELLKQLEKAKTNKKDTAKIEEAILNTASELLENTPEKSIIKLLGLLLKADTNFEEVMQWALAHADKKTKKLVKPLLSLPADKRPSFSVLSLNKDDVIKGGTYSIVHGMFSHDENTVNLNPFSAIEGKHTTREHMGNVLLHEMLHAITSNLIRSADTSKEGAALVAELNRISSEIAAYQQENKDKLSSLENSKIALMLENVHEIIPTVATDADMAALLAKIKSSKTGRPLYHRIFDAVAKAIKSLVSTPVEDSLLHDVMALTEEVYLSVLPDGIEIEETKNKDTSLKATDPAKAREQAKTAAEATKQPPRLFDTTDELAYDILNTKLIEEKNGDNPLSSKHHPKHGWFSTMFRRKATVLTKYADFINGIFLPGLEAKQFVNENYEVIDSIELADLKSEFKGHPDDLQFFLNHQVRNTDLSGNKINVAILFKNAAEKYLPRFAERLTTLVTFDKDADTFDNPIQEMFDRETGKLNDRILEVLSFTAFRLSANENTRIRANYTDNQLLQFFAVDSVDDITDNMREVAQDGGIRESQLQESAAKMISEMLGLQINKANTSQKEADRVLNTLGSLVVQAMKLENIVEEHTLRGDQVVVKDKTTAANGKQPVNVQATKQKLIRNQFWVDDDSNATPHELINRVKQAVTEGIVTKEEAQVLSKHINNEVTYVRSVFNDAHQFREELESEGIMYSPDLVDADSEVIGFAELQAALAKRNDITEPQKRQLQAAWKAMTFDNPFMTPEKASQIPILDLIELQMATRHSQSVMDKLFSDRTQHEPILADAAGLRLLDEQYSSDVQKNTDLRVPGKLHKQRLAAQRNPFKLRNLYNSDKENPGLLNAMLLLSSGSSFLEYLAGADRADKAIYRKRVRGSETKKENATRVIRALNDLIRNTLKGDLNNSFLLPTTVIKNQRWTYLSAFINPQSSKFIRALLTGPDWKFTVTTNPTTDAETKTLNKFKVAVAAGLGISTNKMSEGNAVAEFDKIVAMGIYNEAIEGINAHAADPHYGLDTHEFTNITNAVYAIDNRTAGLVALTELTKYVNAVKSGAAFDAEIGAARDGINDGSIRTALQLMTNLEKMREVAEMGGVYTNKTKNHSSAENRELHGHDMATFIATKAVNNLEKKKSEIKKISPEGGTAISRHFDMQSNFVGHINKNYFDVEGKIKTVLRDLTKFRLTESNYGAAVKLLLTNLEESFLDAVLDTIEDNHTNFEPNTEGTFSDAHIGKYRIYNQNIYDSINELLQSHIDNNFEIPGIHRKVRENEQYLINTNQALDEKYEGTTGIVFTAMQRQVIKNAMAATLGKEIVAVLQQELKDATTTSGQLREITEVAQASYSAVYNAEKRRVLGLRNASIDEEVTIAEEEMIAESLSFMAPTIKTSGSLEVDNDYAGIAPYSVEKIDDVENATIAVPVNEHSVLDNGQEVAKKAISVTVPERAIVDKSFSTTVLWAISGDATDNAAALSNKDRTVINIYDGIIDSANTADDTGYKQNESFYSSTIAETSMIENFVVASYKAVNGLEAIKHLYKDDPMFREDYLGLQRQYQATNPIDGISSNSKKAFPEEFLRNTVIELSKAYETHLKFAAEVLNVDHYEGHFSNYETSKEQREDLKKRSRVSLTKLLPKLVHRNSQLEKPQLDKILEDYVPYEELALKRLGRSKVRDAKIAANNQATLQHNAATKKFRKSKREKREAEAAEAAAVKEKKELLSLNLVLQQLSANSKNKATPSDLYFTAVGIAFKNNPELISKYELYASQPGVAIQLITDLYGSTSEASKRIGRVLSAFNQQNLIPRSFMASPSEESPELYQTTDKMFEQLNQMDAKNNNAVSQQETTRLAKLLNTLVSELYGNTGAIAGFSRVDIAENISDLYSKHVAENIEAFSSEIRSAGFGLNYSQLFAAEQIELTMREAMNSATQADREIYRVFKEIRKQASPDGRDFFMDADGNLQSDAAWAQASPQEKAKAKRMYDTVFKQQLRNESVGGQSGRRRNKDLLARFAALSLVHPRLQEMTNRLVDTTSDIPVDADAPLGQQIENVFARTTRKLGNLKNGVNSRQKAREKIEILSKRLILNEAVERKRLHADNVDVFKFMDQGFQAVGREGIEKFKEINASIAKKEPDNTIGRIVVTGSIYSQAQADLLINKLAEYRDVERVRELVGPFRKTLAMFKHETDSAQAFHYMRALVNKAQQMRNNILRNTRHVALNVFADSEEFTKTQTQAIGSVVLRNDLAALVDTDNTVEDLHELIVNKKARKAELRRLEKAIRDSSSYGHVMVKDATDLGIMLATNQVVGEDVYSNAYQIAVQLGRGTDIDATQSAQTEYLIDRLASLVALDLSSQNDIDAITPILETEKARGEDNALGYVIQTMKHLRADQEANIFHSKRSAIKGYLRIPTTPYDTKAMALKSDHEKMIAQGYVWVSDVEIDPDDPFQLPRANYVSKNLKAKELQAGIISFNSANPTRFGTFGRQLHGSDLNTQIPAQDIQRMSRRKKSKSLDHKDPGIGNYTAAKAAGQGKQHMLPVRDDNGVVVGYQYVHTYAELEQLTSFDMDFSAVMAQTQAHQYDRVTTKAQNESSIRAIRADWERNFYRNSSDYVTIGANSEEPYMREMYERVPADTKALIRELWGTDNFQVHHTLVDVIMGYPKITLDDLLKENNKDVKGIAKNIQQSVGQTIEQMFGDMAAKRLKQGNDISEETVRAIKDVIVIRSGKVLLNNQLSNMIQLWMREVPIKDIANYQVQAAHGLLDYQKQSNKKLELESLLNGSVSAEKRAEYRDQLREVDYQLKRNKVKPLMEAGLFSSLQEDIDNDKVESAYTSVLETIVDKARNKTPDAVLSAVDFLTVAQNTKLYKLMNKGTQMSDFIARYAYYQHLQNNNAKLPANERIDEQKIIAMVRQENINYETPLPRWLEFMDRQGLMFFTKYAIHVQKIIFNLAQNHTSRAATVLLANQFVANIDNILDSNFISEFGNPFEMGALKIITDDPAVLPLPLDILHSLYSS